MLHSYGLCLVYSLVLQVKPYDKRHLVEREDITPVSRDIGRGFLLPVLIDTTIIT